MAYSSEKEAEEPELLADGGVVTEEWLGPFEELDRDGHPTGYRFVRCPDCGIEVLDGYEEHARHQAGCRFRGD